jgi:hypothetical protein
LHCRQTRTCEGVKEADMVMAVVLTVVAYSAL